MAFALLACSVTGARSAELVMFEQPFCEWCEAWDEEVGVVYSRTSEGGRVPVRKVDIHAERPADLRNISAVIYTPTFVLMHDGKEIGRILGYPGEDHFWGLLNMMLKRLPADVSGRRAPLSLAQKPNKPNKPKKE